MVLHHSFKPLLSSKAGGKNGFSYGNPYGHDPDRPGLSVKCNDASKAYFEGTFANDIALTIIGMLTQDVVNANPDVKINYTGYAEFFNLDDDWCDEKSFNTVPSFVDGIKKAFLSHVLRSDMNDLTDKVNNVIQSVTNQFAKQNMRYVSVNKGFEGHPFCEKGSFHSNEYYSFSVWFWNPPPPPLFSGNANTTAQFDDQGQFLAALTANGTATAPASLDLNAAMATPLPENDDNISVNSNMGSVSDGWRMRLFHPKVT